MTWKAACIHVLLAIALPAACVAGIGIYIFEISQSPSLEFFAGLILAPTAGAVIIAGDILSKKARDSKGLGHICSTLTTRLISACGYIELTALFQISDNFPDNGLGRWLILAVLCAMQLVLLICLLFVFTLLAKASRGRLLVIAPLAVAITIVPLTLVGFAVNPNRHNHEITFPIYTPGASQPQAVAIYYYSRRTDEPYVVMELHDPKLTLRQKKVPSSPPTDQACATEYYISSETDETVNNARCIMLTHTKASTVYELAYQTPHYNEQLRKSEPITHYRYIATYDGTLISTQRYTSLEDPDYQLFRATSIQLLSNLVRSNTDKGTQLKNIKYY